MKCKYKKDSVGATIGRPQLTKPSLNPNTKHQMLNTNQKGITIIALIVTIVLMLILASVTIYVGTDSIEHSKMVKFIAYMQAIQKKVDQIVEDGNYAEYGIDLTIEQESILKEILELEDVSGFKYFDSNAIKEQLEVENVEDEIAINFITREVVSLLGFEYEGIIHYTQYTMPGGQKLADFEETKRTVTIGEITSTVDGLNGTFTISEIGITNGTLSYSKDLSRWVTVTNYTKKNQNITTANIMESGTYYFKLVDNTNGTDNIDEEGNYPSCTLRLTNKPKLKGKLGSLSTSYNYSDLSTQENWAYATDNTITYVWIPRFAYETENISNIEFLRGTSDVTSSGGYVDENWTIPAQFTEGSTELTGVWVQADIVNQDGIDIIEIIETGTIYNIMNSEE